MELKKHKLIVATRNAGKLKELKALLKNLHLEIFSAADLHLDDVEETGKTFRENAELKARACWSPGVCTLADDSGLCVDILNGAPGVHSARFAHQQTGGQAGEPKNDEANIRFLLEKMKSVPDEKRQAHFSCVLVLKAPAGKEFTCEGRVDGLILREKRGSAGFGYDPIFYLPSVGKTMAELDSAAKNNISHRAKAFSQLEKVLVALLSENE